MNTLLRIAALAGRRAYLPAFALLLLGVLAACGNGGTGSAGTGNNGGGSLPPGTELLYVGDIVGEIHGFALIPIPAR